MSARVLVVDDDTISRRVLARAVSALGYEAVTAADGAAALATLRAPSDGEPFDVVVLDLLMPVMDGFATLQAIRADAVFGHVPVLVASGVEDLGSITRAIELGATDYLPKPVSGPLLRARLRASLAAKRLRDVELDHLAQVDRVVQAAVAIEAGSYEVSRNLDDVAAREDACGVLARVFQRMARQVEAREAALRADIAELRIEIDQARRLQQVAEVTQSDSYRRLADDAAGLKRILADKEGDGDG